MSIPESPDKLGTKHLLPKLAQRSARGGVITVVAQLIKLLLRTASTMVLARLLTPADFGLIAMASFFTGMLGLFRDLGLSAATVQREDVKHSEVSTMFWVNLGISVILTILGVCLSPLIARFYGENQLVWIVIVLSCSLIFAGVSAQYLAILQRRMEFMKLAAIDIASMIVSVLAAIGVATTFANYWALVVLSVAHTATTMILAAILSGWHPGRWHFDSEVSLMIKFGRNLTGFNLLNFISRNADNLLLGKFVSSFELGIYSKAYGLLLLPFSQINRPIAAVAIPTLGRLQSNPIRYRKFYLKIVQVIAYASMPLTVVLGILSDEVVLIMLGNQWADAAALFRVFVFFVVVQNVVSTTGWVLQSLGETGRMFQWGCIQAPIFLVACLIGLYWGAYGVAVAVTTQSLLLTFPAMIFAYRVSPVTTTDVIHAIHRPFLVSILLLVVCSLCYSQVAAQAIFVRVSVVLCAAAVTALLLYFLVGVVKEDINSSMSLIARKRQN